MLSCFRQDPNPISGFSRPEEDGGGPRVLGFTVAGVGRTLASGSASNYRTPRDDLRGLFATGLVAPSVIPTARK